MPRQYVDNAYNRSIGRVGMTVGTAVVSKSSGGSASYQSASSSGYRYSNSPTSNYYSGNSSCNSSPNVYADNAMNRGLGRVGMEHGTAVHSRSNNYSSKATDSAKVHVDNTMNRNLGHVSLPYGSAVHSRSDYGSDSHNSSSSTVYVDNALNRNLGRVGLPHGTAVHSKSNQSSYSSFSSYVDNALNRRLGRVGLEKVSLYPPTWRNKRNGLRIDIVEKLAAAKPSILRFPGGSFLEGFESGGDIHRYIWEETIGPIEQRPGHPGLWNYYASNGIGMLEYLELAEDLNATAVMGVYAGYSLSNFSYPLEEMGPIVQSALNAIEYAIGDTSTTWGSIRAANGHPDPFPLPYVEIGNEDYFSVDYEIRYPLFYDAITARFPQITIVSTDYVEVRPVPVRDDHYFVGLGGFPARHTLYDDMPRNGSKVYIGEYATRDGDFNYTGELVIAHLAAAIEDASFMISMERNSDLIIMSSYAPLFCNVNDLRWTPNAIYFDGLSSYATPAWWVQHLFSTKSGNIYIPSNSDGNSGSFFHSAVLNTATNTVVIKVVNNAQAVVSVDANLMGICSTLGGKVTVLTGARFDSNSLQEMMKISPAEQTFKTTTNTFTFNAPAYSLTIFEIQFANDSCQSSSGRSTLHKHLLYYIQVYVYTLLFIYAAN